MFISNYSFGDSKFWVINPLDAINGIVYNRSNNLASLTGATSCQLSSNTSGVYCGTAISGERLYVLLSSGKFGNHHTNQNNGVIFGFLEETSKKIYTACSASTYVTKGGKVDLSAAGNDMSVNVPRYQGEYSIFIGNLAGKPADLLCNMNGETATATQMSWITPRLIGNQPGDTTTAYNDLPKVKFKVVAPSCAAEVAEGISWTMQSMDGTEAGGTVEGVNFKMKTYSPAIDGNSPCYTPGAELIDTTSRKCVNNGFGQVSWEAVSGPGCAKMCQGFDTGSVRQGKMKVGTSMLFHAGSQGEICKDGSQYLIKSVKTECVDPGGNDAAVMNFYRGNGSYIWGTDNAPGNTGTIKGFMYCKPRSSSYYRSQSNTWSNADHLFYYRADNPFGAGDRPNDGDKVLWWLDLSTLNKHMDLRGVDVRYSAAYSGGGMVFDNTIASWYGGNSNVRIAHDGGFGVMVSARVMPDRAHNWGRIFYAGDNETEVTFASLYEPWVTNKVKIAYGYNGYQTKSYNPCKLTVGHSPVDHAFLNEWWSPGEALLMGMKDSDMDSNLWNYDIIKYGLYLNPHYSPARRIVKDKMEYPLNPVWPVAPLSSQCNMYSSGSDISSGFRTGGTYRFESDNKISFGGSGIKVIFHAAVGFGTWQWSPWKNSDAWPVWPWQSGASQAVAENGISGDYNRLLNMRRDWRSTFGYSDNFDPHSGYTNYYHRAGGGDYYQCRASSGLCKDRWKSCCWKDAVCVWGSTVSTPGIMIACSRHGTLTALPRCNWCLNENYYPDQCVDCYDGRYWEWTDNGACEGSAAPNSPSC
ncbi:hypothetical protein [Rickettsiales endosymbiont of Stachyamoeba lipophora]|uniref:hypothetical protein n=1 Tax=Rickettsiales endosymbiont of Stachyamoeba lipophora TaxID=2486578 RepID=UPI000F64A8BF|nr:hypothetical protein [Rickettsiales endosymbiont of Stachyamoeba lipophora]AZL15224.1 hypothetical protein EF513_01440 [Rickettsiales endosymbiont of Stachyamoeba lipophora]